VAVIDWFAMSVEQITTIISNVLQGTGIVFFVGMLIRGLRREISSLNQTVKTQQQTLEAMERRVAETERLGEVYRKFLHTMPEDLEKYQLFIRQTKDGAIAELERTNQLKDEQIKLLSQPEATANRKRASRMAEKSRS
jgi:cell division protein FtsB